jgi:hypothetical protein
MEKKVTFLVGIEILRFIMMGTPVVSGAGFAELDIYYEKIRWL